MSAPRAADLPVGSVVADRRRAFIKTEMNLGLDRDNWRCTSGSTWSDHEIDDWRDPGGHVAEFSGPAVVLRVGDGSDQ